MNNLSKFGVQELNAQEIRETDGGFLPLLLLGAAVLLTGCSGAKTTISATVKKGDTSVTGSVTIDRTQPKDSIR